VALRADSAARGHRMEDRRIGYDALFLGPPNPSSQGQSLKVSDDGMSVNGCGVGGPEYVLSRAVALWHHFNTGSVSGAARRIYSLRTPE